MNEIPNRDPRHLALRLVEGNSERGKVDFKRDLDLDTAAGKMEFCKDLSAIANSDDDRLDGYGLIIIGAKPGTLLGGVKAWTAGREDNWLLTRIGGLRRWAPGGVRAGETGRS
jgi:hypothetical protein